HVPHIRRLGICVIGSPLDLERRSVCGSLPEELLALQSDRSLGEGGNVRDWRQLAGRSLCGSERGIPPPHVNPQDCGSAAGVGVQRFHTENPTCLRAARVAQSGFFNEKQLQNSLKV
ncbi:hypothetical protein AVEN_31680-1, partial [Araneus ventricosus]